MERKSFILHLDSLEDLNELSKEEIGTLFLAMIDYNKNVLNGNEEDLIINDKLLEFIFKPFKKQFIRDFKRYQSTSEKRRLAGAKGGKATQQQYANNKKEQQLL